VLKVHKKLKDAVFRTNVVQVGSEDVLCYFILFVAHKINCPAVSNYGCISCISFNNIKKLILVMYICCVFFEVRTEFVYIMSNVGLLSCYYIYTHTFID
jgi:hypothetical protein